MKWFSTKEDPSGFVQANVPNAYALRRESRHCRSCGCHFKVDFSAGDDLVAFQDTQGSEFRWLPTYEKGGYLDLLPRLVTDYADGKQITYHVARAFEAAFDLIQERPASGGWFHTWHVKGCPSCGSREVVTEGVSIRKNPRLTWMRYNLSRLRTE